MPEPAASDAEPAAAVYRLGPDAEPACAAPAPAPNDRIWIEPLLCANAVWFCRLRWLVVAVLLAVAAAGWVPGLTAAVGLHLTPGWPATLAALLAGLNLGFERWARRLAAPGAGGSVRALLWAQITSDLVILTAVLYWVGPEWPAAPFMYLFHLILACLVFWPGESLAVATLAAALYVLELTVVRQGWLPYSTVRLEGGRAPVAELQRAWQGLWPLLLIWAVIGYLVSRLAGLWRQRERELAATNLRLSASSEERAHHMLQTTHQLKAPFAAIHAMTQVLLGGYAGPLPPLAREVVEKIAQRCLALSRQIQAMLQLANLRSRAQAAPPHVALDLAAVVGEVLGRLEPAARLRGIRVEAQLTPAPLLAPADHLTMLVENLVENAVTYSHDGGVVEVTCAPRPEGGGRLSVRDQGIGIPPDKLPRIFQDYFRTEEAVRHNRASTGLGLAIVRQAARELGAVIEVASTLGRGTRFTVDFPAAPPRRRADCPGPDFNLTLHSHGLPVDRG